MDNDYSLNMTICHAFMPFTICPHPLVDAISGSVTHPTALRPILSLLLMQMLRLGGNRKVLAE